MKKIRWMTIIMLVGAVCFWAGCDDDDDKDDSAPAAADAPADAADAVDAFSQITPSGLGSDVFTIAGRGTVVTLSCSAISGADTYAFTTSMGQSQSSSTPEVGINVAAAPPAGSTFSVYATNGDGVNTRTANGAIN